MCSFLPWEFSTRLIRQTKLKCLFITATNENENNRETQICKLHVIYGILKCLRFWYLKQKWNALNIQSQPILVIVFIIYIWYANSEKVTNVYPQLWEFLPLADSTVICIVSLKLWHGLKLFYFVTVSARNMNEAQSKRENVTVWLYF